MIPIFRKASLALTYGSLGAVLGLIIAFVIYLDSRSNLQLWHIVELDAEFTAESNVADFEAYLALEDRLFRQLDQAIYDMLPAARDQSIDRYRRGSLSDPQRWSPDWNRSFVLPTESPNAAVLLLHGMSDSPYCLDNPTAKALESFQKLMK